MIFLNVLIFRQLRYEMPEIQRPVLLVGQLLLDALASRSHWQVSLIQLPVLSKRRWGLLLFIISFGISMVYFHFLQLVAVIHCRWYFALSKKVTKGSYEVQILNDGSQHCLYPVLVCPGSSWLLANESQSPVYIYSTVYLDGGLTVALMVNSGDCC